MVYCKIKIYKFSSFLNEKGLHAHFNEEHFAYSFVPHVVVEKRCTLPVVCSMMSCIVYNVQNWAI